MCAQEIASMVGAGKRGLLWQFLTGMLLFFLATTSARATFGGPQTIELLGFDVRSDEIVFLRNFHDEFDHDTELLPQIYRLKLEDDAVAVKVDSPYYGAMRTARKLAGEHYDFRENNAGFNASIQALKASLAPMAPLRA